MGTASIDLFAKYMSMSFGIVDDISNVNTGGLCSKNNSWQTLSYGYDALKTIYIYIYK